MDIVVRDILIAEPPEAVWSVIADVERTGEWSPECVRCRWLDGADRPFVGARYRGVSRNGRRRWTTTSTIVTAVAGVELVWDVTFVHRPVARWRYRLTASGDGRTLLEESVEDRRERWLQIASPWVTGSRHRAERNASTIGTSLMRIKAIAEAEHHPSVPVWRRECGTAECQPHDSSIRQVGEMNEYSTRPNTRWNVEVTVDSTAPIEDVWGLLADVRTWPEWSSFDEATYARTGDPTPHGVGAARAFRFGRFRSVDTVIEYTTPTNLAYDYRGPLPIKDYRADVELSSLAGGGTRIEWRCQFVPKIPMTGRLMQAVLRKVLSDLSRQLARGAELPPASLQTNTMAGGASPVNREIDARRREPNRRTKRLIRTR